MNVPLVVIRMAVVLAFAGLGVAVAGCGSESDPVAAEESNGSIYAEDPAFEDDEAAAEELWDSQDGPDWDEFSDGYLGGWESGCDIAFEGSPDGSLYDQGNEYTADDCYDLAPYDASLADVPLDVPLGPYDEGVMLGETDGCVAAFDELTSYGVLNWGEDSYDESVCP